VTLVFDEIFLRESLGVDTKNLTYLGLKDLGDDFDNKAELANHALVLIIQSLAESLHQFTPAYCSICIQRPYES